MRNTIRLSLLAVAALILLAVGANPAQAEKKTLTVMSHDSFNISKTVLASFEEQHQVTVRFLKAGDAGSALVQAILAKDRPLADLFYGVDNTFLSRALTADIFAPHPSPLLALVPAALRHPGDDRLLPVSYGDVCLNYDRQWFQSRGLPPPADLADLLKPEYRGLTVVENPATSSPGLAFLLATIGRFGEEGYLEFWRGLRANQVLVANGWKDAYYGHFTAASKGNRPIVVSYASSPPAAVHYATTPLEEAPTAAVLSDHSAFRQIEYVGILKGAKEPELAGKLIDFMLSPAFQEDIPLQMFVFPVNPEARLPEVFRRHAAVAERPATVAPEAIEAKRDQWIEAWTTAVLR
jgi:thiamine transport system substrate-binding protein